FGDGAFRGQLPAAVRAARPRQTARRAGTVRLHRDAGADEGPRAIDDDAHAAAIAVNGGARDRDDIPIVARGEERHEGRTIGCALRARRPEREHALEILVLERGVIVGYSGAQRVFRRLRNADRHPQKERAGRRHSSLKLIVIVISTRPGSPLSSVGVYRHWRTASIAA